VQQHVRLGSASLMTLEDPSAVELFLECWCSTMGAVPFSNTDSPSGLKQVTSASPVDLGSSTAEIPVKIPPSQEAPGNGQSLATCI